MNYPDASMRCKDGIYAMRALLEYMPLELGSVFDCGVGTQCHVPVLTELLLLLFGYVAHIDRYFKQKQYGFWRTDQKAVAFVLLSTHLDTEQNHTPPLHDQLMNRPDIFLRQSDTQASQLQMVPSKSGHFSPTQLYHL